MYNHNFPLKSFRVCLIFVINICENFTFMMHRIFIIIVVFRFMKMIVYYFLRIMNVASLPINSIEF